MQVKTIPEDLGLGSGIKEQTKLVSAGSLTRFVQ